MNNLANKYRPTKFEDVKAQDASTGILKSQLQQGDYRNAYLFCGGAGTGKTTTARIFANEINKGQGNPIEIDAASNNGVDNIRDIIADSKFKSLDSEFKVYIIDEVHMLSIGAFNALLKTLEEPPEHAVIILITSNEHKMLNTIKSRVVKIYFNELEQKDIELILKKEYGIENTNNDIIKYAGGSVEMALRLYNNNDLYIKINEIFSNLDKIDIIDLLNSKEEVFEKKEFIEDILDYINILFYNLSKKDIRYINCLREIINTKERLASNANYNMTMDNFLFTVWGEIND